METVGKLEVKLTEFAKKHAKEIQSDPAFRQRFLQMCAPLGVDLFCPKKDFGVRYWVWEIFIMNWLSRWQKFVMRVAHEMVV
jgi:hypothetical protein